MPRRWRQFLGFARATQLETRTVNERMLEAIFAFRECPEGEGRASNQTHRAALAPAPLSPPYICVRAPPPSSLPIRGFVRILCPPSSGENYERVLGSLQLGVRDFLGALARVAFARANPYLASDPRLILVARRRASLLR